MATLTPNKVTPDAPEPKSSSLKWLWIAIAILAVLIVIPIALLLAGRGTEDGTTTTTQTAPTSVATTLFGSPSTSEPTTPTTVGPTTPTSTPVTTIPATTIPPTTVPTTTDINYDVNVADLVAAPLEGTLVASATWGDGAAQIGWDKDAGPCCFDVFDQDGVIVLDSQNLRLMRFEVGEQPSQIATFDASDLVPDAMAVFNDTVVVVGMTNRAADPYDVVVLSADTGEVLDRGPAPGITINGDLRATPDGVFWAAPASQPQWMAVVDEDGEVLGPLSQTVTDELPGPTTLVVSYDAGIEVQVQPPGDAPLTIYDVTSETAFFTEVFKYSGYTDGALAMFGGEYVDGVAPITLVEMGTGTDGSLVTTAHTFEVERWATTGSFGTFRYAYGGFWVLNTTEDGIEIVRYDLN